MTDDKHAIREIVDQALDAFWCVVARRFRNATTGDLSIDCTCRLQIMAEKAVEEWVYLNVPTPGRSLEPSTNV